MEHLELIQDLLENKYFIALLQTAFFLVVLRTVNMMIDRFAKRAKIYIEDMELLKQINTVKSIAKSISSTIIVIFGAMYVLTRLGVDIRPILTAAGVMGVAIGLGAKRFVEDLISGFLIIVEGQIRVGDVVEIAGKTGTVEKIDIKMVVLRDAAGNLHFIRNSMIDIVTNMTRDYSYSVFDISIDYKESIDKVTDILKELDKDFRENSKYKHDIYAALEILGVDKLAESAVIIKARYRTRPKMQWEIGREFNRVYKNKFDELGITIPYPQCVIHTYNNQ